MKHLRYNIFSVRLPGQSFQRKPVHALVRTFKLHTEGPYPGLKPGLLL